MAPRPTGGSSGCSGWVSDHWIGTVRASLSVTLHKEQLRRDPPEPPHPPSPPGAALSTSLSVASRAECLERWNRRSTDRGRRSNIEPILRVEDGNGRSKT